MESATATAAKAVKKKRTTHAEAASQRAAKKANFFVPRTPPSYEGPQEDVMRRDGEAR
jgi:hypothetical protein